MRTIIAGSRDLWDYPCLKEAIEKCGWPITEVVCGGAAGIDTLGKRWACENKIPVTTIMANWKKHGRSAGPIRNVEMAEQADALVAVWDGESKGTKHMIETAKSKGLRVHVEMWNYWEKGRRAFQA